MARTVKDASLVTREARSTLKGRGKPYYRLIEPGLHLGYRRPRGRRGKPAGAGKWVIRQYIAKSYTVAVIGVADDFSDADGVAILSFAQAQQVARDRMVKLAHAAAGPLTVRAAVEAYIAQLSGSAVAVADTRGRAEAHIYPELGDVVIGTLSAAVLRNWLHELATAPVRRRTKADEPQKYGDVDGSADGIRRRKATANRIWSTLRASLNLAFRDGLVETDVWRRVQPFKDVDAARPGYLSVAEAQRLVNAADPAFRSLLQAALSTGCRYGELCRLEVRDFHADSGTVVIRHSKSGKSRHVVLTDEGVALFRQLTAGRAGHEILLRKDDGGIWTKGGQTKPMRLACERARITPAVGFHVTRHSWASLSAMSGMPLMVIANNLGHSGVAMVTRHYAHLSRSHISDAIREHAPVFGFASDEKVTSLQPRPRRGR
jgi:integrase